MNFEQYKIIPVITINDASKANNLANALLAGGIRIAEVTYRTNAAGDSIKEMSKIEGMCVGAGSIATVEMAKDAIKNGAQFLVCAGTNISIIQYAKDNNIPIIPGIATASEILTNIEMGIETCKFFPAEMLGGIKMLKAISAPFPSMKFLPTGGITVENMNDYLQLKNVIAVGGTWIVNPKLIDNDRFDEITQLCKSALSSLD